MRTAKYFILLLATLLSLTLHAQHCPYDGSNIVIVKLVDAKGNTVNTKNYSAWLKEVDNPLADSCTYATGLLKLPLLDKADFFIHPVIRAILLHFMLAYDHPFVDGTGRTARALFYWSMAHQGYWLMDFISIT